MIPYDTLDTLFLDAGNTLVSIDFAWVAAEVSARGIPCTPEELRRAEAAARPGVSESLARGRSTEPDDVFVAYLRLVLGNLASAATAGPAATETLARDLLPVLRVPGRADRLWRAVLPGVPEALECFRSLGLRLVVVSNADGSVERGLETAGLRGYFSHVLDSARVGYEKPDPRIFAEALTRSGATAERTLHVGDLLHADVLGARSAGLHAALLDPFGDWTEVDCPVFPDLLALARVLGAR